MLILDYFYLFCITFAYQINYRLYQMKTKVLVLGGGKSTEHSVSLVSAYNIFHNIPTEFYTPLLVAIDKKGIWRHCEDLILEVGDISKVCINPEA